jgi:sRNA-binding carbon storage regulator CsrA
MLVLSRQKDQRIVFDLSKATDQEIAELVADLKAGKAAFYLTVVDIRGDKVRLGVTAPKCVSVDRDEIHRAKRRVA